MDMDNGSYESQLSTNGRSAQDVSAEGIAAAMYARYSSTNNGTTVEERSLDRRDLTFNWESCINAVSGVCANDNVPDWVSAVSTFEQAIVATLGQLKINDKLNKSPRDAYVNYGKDGFCISWAAYYPSTLSDQQIRNIAAGCANACELQNNSCEARVVSIEVIQFYCVSNRPNNCSPNDQIRTC